MGIMNQENQLTGNEGYTLNMIEGNFNEPNSRKRLRSNHTHNKTHIQHNRLGEIGFSENKYPVNSNEVDDSFASENIVHNHP